MAAEHTEDHLPEPHKFAPSSLLASSLDEPVGRNVEIISCPVPYPLPVFFQTLSLFVLHPEHHSTLILRTTILSESSLLSDPASFPALPNHAQILSYKPFRQVVRRLLPRQPKRDKALNQLVVFHRSEPSQDEYQGQHGVVEYVCLVNKEQDIPFYHPAVKKVRFTYLAAKDDEPDQSTLGRLVISVELFDSKKIDENHKIYRTCLNLLRLTYRNGRGVQEGYEKRVQHDTVVERNSYQDLYLELKEKYAHLESRVISESKAGKEDVKRHVWKDVAIATFLILLWKDTYPAVSTPRQALILPEEKGKDDIRASWGAPPGGFVDVGCGNGLLVHILSSEGYVGQGLELRPRKTWSAYPSTTQDRLKKHAVNPTALLESCQDENFGPFEKGSFFIGNHADEMTPWIPVIAALTPESGFINIPCCLHTLSNKFTQMKYTIPQATVPPGRSQLDVERSLGQASAGRYGAYLAWLAGLGWSCGWEWEREALRIPSTRSWAIIGRRRLPFTPQQETQTRNRVLDIVSDVRQAGLFKPRRAEGKQGDMEEAAAAAVAESSEKREEEGGANDEQTHRVQEKKDAELVQKVENLSIKI
ncbi:Uncharacterized conserved protein [Phaffia rhodozyma]|uniref:tRNA (uracil-O(2)-)-methyltransferase n=1 Tax=Phaffia rhodozyma TaxID=264483 RepID=A0A0F7SY82_PHARH|nr:Uncharacterized conserved protein [Phaffia rhodozyma]